MALLKIIKLSNKTWKHNSDVDGDFILTKFYAKQEDNNFLLVESYGSKRRKYLINEIEVYDISGSAETFANFSTLFLRLEALSYPAFYEDGVFIFNPNDYISSDSGNALVLGTDNNFFVPSSGGGGSTDWSDLTNFASLTSATTPLAGTEELAIVQGGETKRIDVSEVGGTSLRTETYPFVVTNATSFVASTSWFAIRKDVGNSLFNPLWATLGYDGIIGVTSTRIGRRIIMYNQKVKEIALSYSTVSVETKIRFIYYEINPSGTTSVSVNNHIIHEVTIPATTGSSANIVQPTVFVLPTAFTMSKGGMLSMVIFNNNTALTFKDFIAEVITEEVI